VAAGLVAFSLGTDTAGSGRVPAALNGIVGIKPTRGLVSTAGVVPACRSLDCVSVFGPDVHDASAVLRVARGRVAGDPWGRSSPPERPVPRPPDTLRLGLPRGPDLEFFGDGGQAARFAAGQRDVAGHVGSTVPVELGPLFEAGALLYRGPWVAERLADLGPFLRRHPDAVLPVTRAVLENGWKYTAVDAFVARHRLRELRRQAEELWDRVDVLLVPTVGTTFTRDEIAADPIGRNLVLGRYTQFVNLLDLAAVTVPNGFTADGRPASLTMIGPAFSDATLAALASRLTGAPPVDAEPDPGGVTIAVVGRHLAGESRNGELLDRGGVLLGAARTASCYRLYRLATADGVGLPGLVRTADGGQCIDVELWRLPETTIGGLLAGVPAPLSLGRVRLADGREVIGFLCEAYAAGPMAEDITASGGWRAYRAGAASR
jgi:allophanate hydrolase